jgi:hypothetical protein
MPMHNEHLEFAARQLRRARAFEKTALRVIEHDPPRQKSLHAPTLHLIAQGYELVMKSVLSMQSISERNQRQIGHNLKALWEREDMNKFRDFAMKAAIECCQEAQKSGKYTGGFPSEPDNEFVRQILMLSDLHSRESDFSLRYPNATPTLAALPDPLRCVLGKLISYLDTEFGAADTSQ